MGCEANGPIATSWAPKPTANQHALVVKSTANQLVFLQSHQPMASFYLQAIGQSPCSYSPPLPSPQPIRISLQSQLTNQFTLDAVDQSEHPSLRDSGREPIRILWLINRCLQMANQKVLAA